MEQIRGTVERITYVDEESGYSVLRARVKTYHELVTFVGNLLGIKVGSVLTVTGEWKNDKRYGHQFAVSTWEETLPSTELGMEKYLGSGLIKGVGAKYAKLIVATFGLETFTILEENPEKLSRIAGLGQTRIQSIKESWKSQKEIRNLILFLQEINVSPSLASRIYKVFENQSVQKIKENPYCLCEDVHGIGFKTSDLIASKIGIDSESYIRCKSGVLYAMSKLAEQGHCFAVFDQLVSKAVELLNIDEAKIIYTTDYMIKQADLISDDKASIYLPPLYFSESGAAKKIKQILSSPVETPPFLFDAIIQKVQNQTNIIYDDIQKEAIKKAVQSKIMVITGGPGTGKTTIVLAMIEIFKQLGFQINLCAPTGRAAKRLSELSGVTAKTIHRLLEYQPAFGFQLNEERKLKGDVLIVDEASMIDIVLMYNLLKGVPDDMRVIIIGDTDQLPAIGAGNVLFDLIQSKTIPVIKLTKIFRQSLESDIIQNAHRINRGQMPKLSGCSDFFFIPNEKDEIFENQIISLCKNRLPKFYKVDPVRDIQILTPMRKGNLGSESVNQILRSALNPNTLFITKGSKKFKLGDKVMQIKNNYKLDVFNGDIGYVTEIIKEENELVVSFDANKVKYDNVTLDELVLAYAATIHKSQGSEFPVVIILLADEHHVMLKRNLLYTGVTRAKKTLIIMGDRSAIKQCVSTFDLHERNSKLAERLSKL